MSDLREKIDEIIATIQLDADDPVATVESWLDEFERSRAVDAILAIPEIRDALEAAEHWSEGVELPPELIEKMALVYGKPTRIRITDD